jgi:four helix bundle protein
MNNFDTPIFKKTYDLYRTFYSFRRSVPKQDRYTLWQKSDDLLLEVLEGIMVAGQTNRAAKLPVLEIASTKLNMLRVFIRLASEVKAIDNKRYVALESEIDEIGRMLGGWIKSTREV